MTSASNTWRASEKLQADPHSLGSLKKDEAYDAASTLLGDPDFSASKHLQEFEATPEMKRLFAILSHCLPEPPHHTAAENGTAGKDQSHPSVATEAFSPQTISNPLLSDHTGCTQLLTDVDARAASERSALLMARFQCTPQMIDLLRQVDALDDVFAAAEDKLTRLQKDLKSATQRVSRCQQEAKMLDDAMSSKRDFKQTVASYIDQTLVTPEFASTLQEAPVNAAYIGHVRSLQTKLENCNQLDPAAYPSVRETLPKLQALHTESLSRIQDHLVARLKFLRFSTKRDEMNSVEERALYVFLKECYPAWAAKVRQGYLFAAQEALLTHCRTYTRALLSSYGESTWMTHHNAPYEFLGGDGLATRSLPLGRPFKARDAVSAFFGLSNTVEAAVLTEPPCLTHSVRGTTLFGLKDRDGILRHLKDPPEVPQGGVEAHRITGIGSCGKVQEVQHTAQRIKYLYPESYFRSCHAFVIALWRDEYQFIKEIFFASQSNNPTHTLEVSDSTPDLLENRSSLSRSFSTLVTQIFDKVLGHLAQNIQTIVSGLNDSVGLFLMIAITAWNKKHIRNEPTGGMHQYLDEIELVLWHRFKWTLDMHLKSLDGIHIKKWIASLPASRRTSIHPITRRYVDLIASLFEIDRAILGLHGDSGEGLCPLIPPLHNAMVEALQDAASEVTRSQMDTLECPVAEGIVHSTIFLINNYDCLRQLDLYSLEAQHCATSDNRTLLRQFDSDFQLYAERYVTEQLHHNFVQFFSYVKQLSAATPCWEHREASPRHHQFSQSAEHVAQTFTRDWEETLRRLHSRTITSFDNLSTAMMIFKQMLTQLLLTLAKFQEHLCHEFPSQMERQSLAWVRALPDTQTILHAAKQYAKTTPTYD